MAWLLQVGVTRGGWYSYDLLDNLGRPSADRIISAFQGVEVGDVIPMSPDGKQGLLVHELDLPRSMTWVTPGATSWVWVAEPQADGTTRLITRIRSRYRWLSPSIAFSGLIEFGDIWMMRKMLRTLRERVEGDSPPVAEPSPQQASDGSLSPFPGGRLLPRPLRASVRTAVFFLKVLPMLPSGVVDLLTGRPIVEQVTYPTRRGTAVGDLYRPATSSPVLASSSASAWSPSASIIPRSRGLAKRSRAPASPRCSTGRQRCATGVSIQGTPRGWPSPTNGSWTRHTSMNPAVASSEPVSEVPLR